MAHLCGREGCRQLTPHSHASRAGENRSRGSSTDRGLGWEWQKTRNRQLAAEPLCRICREVLGRVVVATTVDHIVPRVRGGGTEDSNLQSLCGFHNDAKGDRDDAEYRASLK